MRAAEPRDVEATWRKVGQLLDLFSAQECANYLKNSGYVSVQKHHALEERVGLYVTGFEMLIEPGDTARIVRNNSTLWLYCSVTFDDFMQTRHEVGICWHRYETFGGGGFRPDATSAYNRKT